MISFSSADADDASAGDAFGFLLLPAAGSAHYPASPYFFPDFLPAPEAAPAAASSSARFISYDSQKHRHACRQRQLGPVVGASGYFQPNQHAYIQGNVSGAGTGKPCWSCSRRWRQMQWCASSTTTWQPSAGCMSLHFARQHQNCRGRGITRPTRKGSTSKLG